MEQDELSDPASVGIPESLANPKSA